MKPIAHIKTRPEFAAATKERESLAIALGKVNGRIDEIEALLRASTSTHDRESSHVAAALHFAETGQVQGAGNQPTELREEHAVLRQQREALEKAIRAKSESMHLIASNLSAELARELEPRHRKLAGRYVELLKQVDAIHEEEAALVNEIESAGYTARFREWIQWPLLGRLAMRGESNLWMRLRSFSNYAD